MRRLVCAMIAGLLVLGGCTDDDPPPSVSTPVTTTPANPDVTPPAMPEQASQDSHAGVTQFVRYYLATLSYATETGDTEELEQLSDDNCDACRSYIEATRAVYDSGGSISGGRRTFKRAKVSYRGPEAESLITANVTVTAATKRASTHAPDEITPKGSIKLTFGVIGEGTSRHVSAIYQGDKQ